MEETIAEKLSGFTDELTFETIPEKVIKKTKDLILDTLGICIASSKMDFGKAALGLIAGWGGVPESSLIGSEAKVPAQNAAFANGVLGHGQDYDDTHTESVVHPSACLVPVALSVGEKTGASGREILTALVSGLEVMIRIGMPALNKFHLRGFHTTSICGTFASALVTAKLMGMGREKMVEALGISGSFTSGLLECIPSSSWAKRLHAGWAGLCGIVAAELANTGYTGPRTVFEGKLGLYNSFLRSESIDLNVIFKSLGTDWEILNVRPKLYPCCHYLQSYLDCVSCMRKEYRLHPNDIAKIDCKVAQGAVNIICEPWEKKISPKTAYDARFSLPFAVSLMLAKGKAGVEEFSERYLEDEEIRSLMGTLRYEVEPSFLVKDMPGYVSVRLKNEDHYEYEIKQVRGDALHPIQREELLEKFNQNTSFLDRGRGKRIAELIFEFDRLDRMDALTIEMS
ncbi:MAG: MmgE/PrpD family protein [Thermodesulfobacteriota bacterium]|nr:MmgE/PrpD family protein [Thermodesulfobacteriota bacterium]